MKAIDIKDLETITGGNTASPPAGGLGAELGRRAGSVIDRLKTIYRPPPTFPIPSPTFPGGNPWDLFNRR